MQFTQLHQARLFLAAALLLFSTLMYGAEDRVDAERSVRELNGEEQQWLEQSVHVGLEVLAYYADTEDVSPTSLDVAFRNWKSDATESRAPDTVVASGLGVLFGNYIVARKDSSWVVVSDSFGTDLAIRSPEGQEMYPITSVWKRIDPDSGDINFFEPIWTLVAGRELNDR